MICRWLKEYEINGTNAFNIKKRIGNKFAALNLGKYLTENEILKLQIAKLEIKNERLKKMILGERNWSKQGIRYFKRNIPQSNWGFFICGHSPLFFATRKTCNTICQLQ